MPLFPSLDSGRDSIIGGATVCWKTGRAYIVGEGDRVCQTKDGKVVISGIYVVCGVYLDLCDVNPSEVTVSNIVFSNKHTDVG